MTGKRSMATYEINGRVFRVLTIRPTIQDYDFATRTRSRIFVGVEDANYDDTRAYVRQLREAMRLVAQAAGFKTSVADSAKWSRLVGCGCGCSPGFTVPWNELRARFLPVEVHITEVTSDAVAGVL